MKSKMIKLCAMLLALPFLFFAACSFPPVDSDAEEQSDNPPSEFFMIAKIENLDEPFQVNVTEAEYASGPFWIVRSNNIVYADKNGNRIAMSDFKVGDTVKIYYSGQIMMSYPPQVVALKIVKQ